MARTIYSPKRRRAVKMGVREPSVIRCAGHLQWVRGCVCLIGNQHECGGKMEAHHVKIGGSGGMALTGGDDEAVPLCAKAHAELHQHGERTFAAKYGTGDLLLRARNHWRVSPAGIRYRARAAGKE